MGHNFSVSSKAFYLVSTRRLLLFVFLEKLSAPLAMTCTSYPTTAYSPRIFLFFVLQWLVFIMLLVLRIEVLFLITRWQLPAIFLVRTIHISVDFTTQEEMAGRGKHQTTLWIGYRWTSEEPPWCVLWRPKGIQMGMSGWLHFLCHFRPMERRGYIPRIHMGTRRQVCGILFYYVDLDMVVLRVFRCLNDKNVSKMIPNYLQMYCCCPLLQHSNHVEAPLKKKHRPVWKRDIWKMTLSF